jgi:hypothetical protein
MKLELDGQCRVAYASKIRENADLVRRWEYEKESVSTLNPPARSFESQSGDIE